MKKMTFEELYNYLRKQMNNQDISLLIGITPYHPDRYLGHSACGLPIQSIVSIYKHLTFKGSPIMIGYLSFEEMEIDRIHFEGLVGDSPSCRSLGWYKGSEDFTMEVYDETKRLSD